MDAQITAILIGLTGGAFAASLAGPVELGWRQHPLRLRVALLSEPMAGPLRRRLGAGALALVLAGGALPSAPERLPAQVAGVVGSGDQLSLRLKAEPGAPQRTLKIGEEFEEGWKLKGLTNTEATLEKAGETRQVGLNPTGVVASAASADGAAKITLAGLPDEAMIARMNEIAVANRAARGLPPETIRRGLNEEETRRIIAYSEIIGTAMRARSQDRLAAGETLDASERQNGTPLTADERRAVLGSVAFDDAAALNQRVVAAIPPEDAARMEEQQRVMAAQMELNRARMAVIQAQRTATPLP